MKTRSLIVDLDKHGKKTGKRIWRVLAQTLASSSRRRPQAGLYLLGRLAKKNPGKIFVLAGKLLSNGPIESKIEVACFSCSAKAKEKIGKLGGKVMTLDELIKHDPGADKMVMVK